MLLELVVPLITISNSPVTWFFPLTQFSLANKKNPPYRKKPMYYYKGPVQESRKFKSLMQNLKTFGLWKNSKALLQPRRCLSIYVLSKQYDLRLNWESSYYTIK